MSLVGMDRSDFYDVKLIKPSKENRGSKNTSFLKHSVKDNLKKNKNKAK